MMGLRTAAAVVWVAACAAGGPVDEREGGDEIAFESIVDQTSSGLDERLDEVIRDSGRWAALWDQIQRRVTPRPPLPPVDFSRHMLIAVAAGTRTSGGYDIAVHRVAVRENALVIEVVESCPAPGAMVIMALTQPVEVVRLPKLPQTAVFRHSKGPSCR